MSVTPKLAAKIAALPPGPLTVPFAEYGCALSARSNHRPTPAVSQLHHVWPLGLGGPPRGERIPLCGSHHLDVHVAIDAMRKDRPLPPGLGKAELALAREAIARSLAGGTTPP